MLPLNSISQNRQCCLEYREIPSPLSDPPQDLFLALRAPPLIQRALRSCAGVSTPELDSWFPPASSFLSRFD